MVGIRHTKHLQLLLESSHCGGTRLLSCLGVHSGTAAAVAAVSVEKDEGNGICCKDSDDQGDDRSGCTLDYAGER